MNSPTEKKFILAIGIIALIILTGVLVDRFKNPGNGGFTIYIPYGLVAAFISFYLFREFNRAKKTKRDERREEINERRQELLDNLLKAKKKEEKNIE